MIAIYADRKPNLHPPTTIRPHPLAHFLPTHTPSIKKHATFEPDRNQPTKKIMRKLLTSVLVLALVVGGARAAHQCEAAGYEYAFDAATGRNVCDCGLTDGDTDGSIVVCNDGNPGSEGNCREVIFRNCLVDCTSKDSCNGAKFVDSDVVCQNKSPCKDAEFDYTLAEDARWKTDVPGGRALYAWQYTRTSGSTTFKPGNAICFGCVGAHFHRYAVICGLSDRAGSISFGGSCFRSSFEEVAQLACLGSHACAFSKMLNTPTRTYQSGGNTIPYYVNCYGDSACRGVRAENVYFSCVSGYNTCMEVNAINSELQCTGAAGFDLCQGANLVDSRVYCGTERCQGMKLHGTLPGKSRAECSYESSCAHSKLSGYAEMLGDCSGCDPFTGTRLTDFSIITCGGSKGTNCRGLSFHGYSSAKGLGLFWDAVFQDSSNYVGHRSVNDGQCQDCVWMDNSMSDPSIESVVAVTDVADGEICIPSDLNDEVCYRPYLTDTGEPDLSRLYTPNYMYYERLVFDCSRIVCGATERSCSNTVSFYDAATVNCFSNSPSQFCSFGNKIGNVHFGADACCDNGAVSNPLVAAFPLQTDPVNSMW